MRTSVSLVLAFAGSVGSAAAQYAPSQPPPVGYPPAAVYAYPANVPVRPSQDDGTAIAALPPEDQPERGSAQELSPQFRRTVVDYPTIEPPGTIIIDTPNTGGKLGIAKGEYWRQNHSWPIAADALGARPGEALTANTDAL